MHTGRQRVFNRGSPKNNISCGPVLGLFINKYKYKQMQVEKKENNDGCNNTEYSP